MARKLKLSCKEERGRQARFRTHVSTISPFLDEHLRVYERRQTGCRYWRRCQAYRTCSTSYTLCAYRWTKANALAPACLARDKWRLNEARKNCQLTGRPTLHGSLPTGSGVCCWHSLRGCATCTVQGKYTSTMRVLAVQLEVLC